MKLLMLPRHPIQLQKNLVNLNENRGIPRSNSEPQGLWSKFKLSCFGMNRSTTVAQISEDNIEKPAPKSEPPTPPDNDEILSNMCFSDKRTISGKFLSIELGYTQDKSHA